MVNFGINVHFIFFFEVEREREKKKEVLVYLGEYRSRATTPSSKRNDSVEARTKSNVAMCVGGNWATALIPLYTGSFSLEEEVCIYKSKKTRIKQASRGLQLESARSSTWIFFFFLHLYSTNTDAHTHTHRDTKQDAQFRRNIIIKYSLKAVHFNWIINSLARLLPWQKKN